MAPLGGLFFIDVFLNTQAILKIFQGEYILRIASSNIQTPGPGTCGNDELVIRNPLLFGLRQIDHLDSFFSRINLSDPVFHLDLNILFLLELLRSSNNQFLLIFYYIADVVGGFSGAIGYELTLLKQGDFKFGVDPFRSRRCAGPPC